MPAEPPHRFPARLDALPSLLAWVAGICAHAGLDRHASLQAELVIEELFTNSIQHGYANDSTRFVWISSRRGTGHLLLRYQDAAPPYNPLAEPPGIPSLTALMRQEGGFGLGLVRGMPRQARYFREDECNILELEFPATAQDKPGSC